MKSTNLDIRHAQLTYNPPHTTMDLMVWNTPRPDLIRTMGQLKEQTKDTFIFDIETDGFLDECTKIHCIALTTPNGDTSLFAQDDVPLALHYLSNAECIVGHNIIGFDIPVIEKLYPGWKTQARIRDTLVLSRLAFGDLITTDAASEKVNKKMWGSHSLEAWGYRLGSLKGEFNHPETDWSVYTQEMGDYCVQDSVVNLHLAHHIERQGLSKRSIELEHAFATELVEMEKNGVGFDRDACVSLYVLLLEEKNKILSEIAEIFPDRIEVMKIPAYWYDPGAIVRENGTYRVKSDAPPNIRKHLVKGPMKTKAIPFNPNSRTQIADAFIEKYGWEPTEWTEGNVPKPRVDEAILEKLDYPEAPAILRYMMLKKRIGQVAEGDNAWLKLEKDGRIYGRINPNGAISGRCTHSKPNMSQVPAPRAEFGPECRAAFNVRPGYKMVGADMSGLELRCLAHYMHRWDKGAYVDVILNGDVHTVNQNAAELETRDLAKTFIYAFLYGGGNEKLGTIIGKGEGAGRVLRAKFLKSLPALASLLKDVKREARIDKAIRGLDGRKLPSRSEHSALNLLMQSTGAILMKQATVNLMSEIRTRKLDAKLVLHVHDEVQLEVREDQADLVGQLAVWCMRKAGHQFSLDCPMDGEYKVGNNWAETH